MLRLEVKLDSDGVKATLERASTLPLADIHAAMAEAVETDVKAYLTSINARSPNTNYFGRAARTVVGSADETQALIRIPHRGMALRYHGGEVKAGRTTSSKTGQPTKNLAIPTDDVPLNAGRDARKPPRDMGLLAYIPKKGKPGGLLVQGQEKTITRGPRKGGTRIVPTPGGPVLYVLSPSTQHKPDPTVLPADDILLNSAVKAVNALLEFDQTSA